GSQIAFTSDDAGNPDVYVVPAAGGMARRLTYRPGADRAVSWTPDGRQVLFRSDRSSFAEAGRLFTMPLDGAFPREILLPMAEEGSFSPDGARLAYVPLARQAAWKQYRGGRTTPVWLAHLADGSIEMIPRQNSNDFNPMWIGS